MHDDAPAADHPFVERPNRTLLALAVPVFFSLIAEPLTGLVDTAFVSRLGAEPLAALGVGTAALSSIFWIFNFLGIGTQTNVAQALGQKDEARAISMTSLALLISVAAGIGLVIAGWLLAPTIASLLGAQGVMQAQAAEYMRIRLLGAPAMLAMLTAFGALRGIQDMRSPLWVALAVNALNIILDALIILGFGPVPALGIAGAAGASALAQTMGAIWAVAVVLRKLGWSADFKVSEVRLLLQIGGDLFIRTGLLTLFLLLATRVATQAGAESGAAHQAIRQFWIFVALGLDALAITAQSLVGFFIGSHWVSQARRVAWYSCVWGVALGVLMAAGMWLGRDAIAALLVPPAALSVFMLPWLAATIVQPINALAFVTDGIHWGTGDFAFLRNAVFIATLVGGSGLWLIDPSAPNALILVWAASAVWIIIRAAFGVLRVWPGIGDAPLSMKTPGTLETSS